MAEYIEREALLDSLRESRKALQEICKGLKFPVEKQICDAQILTFQECVLRVKEQPTADVETVVRCKDCAYANDYGTVCHYGVGRDVKPDHYCGYGERRKYSVL